MEHKINLHILKNPKARAKNQIWASVDDVSVPVIPVKDDILLLPYAYLDWREYELGATSGKEALNMEEISNGSFLVTRRGIEVGTEEDQIYVNLIAFGDNCGAEVSDLVDGVLWTFKKLGFNVRESIIRPGY